MTRHSISILHDNWIDAGVGGAEIIRVHNVPLTRAICDVTKAIMDQRPVPHHDDIHSHNHDKSESELADYSAKIIDWCHVMSCHALHLQMYLMNVKLFLASQAYSSFHFTHWICFHDGQQEDAMRANWRRVLDVWHDIVTWQGRALNDSNGFLVRLFTQPPCFPQVNFAYEELSFLTLCSP